MIQEQAKQEFKNSQSEKQKIEQFKREAMRLYVSDLEQGNKCYSGTAFQANSFARAFADLFDDNAKGYVDRSTTRIQGIELSVSGKR